MPAGFWHLPAKQKSEPHAESLVQSCDWPQSKQRVPVQLPSALEQHRPELQSLSLSQFPPHVPRSPRGLSASASSASLAQRGVRAERTQRTR